MRMRGTEKDKQVKVLWEVLSTHMARRTFVTQAHRSGVPVEIISKLVGHKSIEQTMQYLKLDGDDLQRGIEGMSW